MHGVGILSAQELGLLPSDEDMRFYQEHGWYISKKLLTDQEVDTLVSASAEYYAGKRDRLLPGHPQNISYWVPGDGEIQRNNDYIHYEDHAIGAILRKPLIAAVAARLAEVNLVRMFQATLLFKPPQPDEKSNIVPWHFDKYYWATSSSDNLLTAFIPFHDCPPLMGTITMVDGSHRWDYRGETDSIVASAPDLEREYVLIEHARRNGAEIVKIPVTIPKGHMTFHHCLLYHGSSANLSGRARQAISLHMQDDSNRYRDFRQVTHARRQPYKHDELVRHDTAGNPDYTDPEFCPILWQS